LGITVHCTASTGDWGQRNAPAEQQGELMSRFRPTEWMVPPFIVPLFLGLLILGAAVLHG